jgi:hypothetical protein
VTTAEPGSRYDPIVKVKQTCYACPSQWDAWTRSGNYLYLRYRFGYGTVNCYDEDIEWHMQNYTQVASFSYGDGLDGVIDLETFCKLAGLTLADVLETAIEE